MSGVMITSRDQFEARGRSPSVSKGSSEVLRHEMMIEYIFYAWALTCTYINALNKLNWVA